MITRRTLFVLGGTALVLVVVAVGLAVAVHRHRNQVPAGTTVHAITVGGLQRSYRVHVPGGSGAGRRPLVVMLHGGFGTGQQAENAYGWDDLADREGFLVAYPDGWRRAWNTDGGCCGQPAAQHVDDVAFIEAVVAQIGEQYPLDRRRIYVTGMSNGAMMAYTLACRSTTFAAIGPVAGTQLPSCSAPAPISVIHVHGLADTRVRYDGGRGEGVAHVDGPPVEQVIDRWRRIDGCSAPRVTVRAPVRTSTASCAQGREVRLITVEGAGHQWPGSTRSAAGRLVGADEPSDALDATTVIWDFFRAHPAAR